MDGVSKNITEDQKTKLRELFPEVFTEDQIDFDKLKLTLGENVNVGERYGLTWKGKSNVFKAIQEPTTKTLKPVREESVNFDKSDNLFIEGDNLETLKVLQKSYYGKVKMIYIDPPYNTGNDFVYNDKFAQSQEEYAQEAGIKDAEGNITRTDGLRKNSKDGGHFHSNWLNMMYPRLYLARNLLKQDGVIFISIDDNEVHNLRMIMNEIFGEENFIAQITVIGNPRGRDYGGVARMHDYILVYARSDAASINSLYDEDKKFPQEDSRGGYELRELRNRNIAFNKENRPNLYYPFYVDTELIDENGLYSISLEPKSDLVEVYPKESQGVDTVWRWGKIKSQEFLNTEIKAKKMIDGGFQIVEKYRKKTKMARSVWADKDVNTEKGTLLIKELFEGKKVFDFPKPVELLERVIEMGSNNNDIVLDFFSGSASIAHAVISMNSRINESHRKWICVQLPETTDVSTVAHKTGYGTVADIAKDRIRKASEYIKNKAPDATDLDLGFKVLKLDDTNFTVWDSSVVDKQGLEKQIAIQLHPIKDNSTEEDLLFEIMLKEGIDPTAKIQKDGNYWLVDDENYIICLEKSVTKDDFQQMLNRQSKKVILLDSALQGNDQLKANIVLQAEKNNTELQVI